MMKKTIFFFLLFSILFMFSYQLIKNSDKITSVELIKETILLETKGASSKPSIFTRKVSTANNTYIVKDIKIFEKLKLNEGKQCELTTKGKIINHLLNFKTVTEVGYCTLQH